VQTDDIELFRTFITRRTKWGLVYGPANGGKTTLAKYMGQKYGYSVIEWEPTIAQLKEKLGAPGEPLEDVPLAKIVEYYRKMFEMVGKEKYIFDGFPPGCETRQ
jgi:adenylate kinase family enzyme